MPTNSNQINPAVKTTCPYCGVGCGIDVTVVDPDHRIIQVSGDVTHPANFGRLCSKGSALADTVGLEGRQLYPTVDGQRTGLEEALDKVAHRLQETLNSYGPEAVAFYASGQLLTEDYYVANKLMKGFIGGANIDTNSRLCMASAVVAHKRAFGSDTVPVSYDDLENSDLVILVGSNTAWCHPVLYQRLSVAKQRRPWMKIVVIDPRETDTLDIADLHLAISPKADLTLFTGLLGYLIKHNLVDQPYIEQHTQGFDSVAKKAEQLVKNLDLLCQTTGIPKQKLLCFFDWFGKTEKTITLFSQGVNQSAIGTDTGNAIINLHLATGRIGKPGAGPFSITGQPNAMGGREVGGLANQLAAHMDFDPADVDRVGRFWNSDSVASQPGLKAVDMFDAIDRGEIKFLWVMGTNPAVSLPDSHRIDRALSRCQTVVLSECIADTDTAQYADIVLPAATWGERNGTVTNSERRISRQRSFFSLPGESKPDWWLICEVANRIGFESAFNFSHSNEIFREHAALSAYENSAEAKTRDFNLSALIATDADSYENFAPTQWPVTDLHAGYSESRLFEDGVFFTENGKARFVDVADSLSPTTPESEQYPMLLNTGRIRDQWHTMSRTGLSPRLNAAEPEPYIDIHPKDAEIYSISEAELIKIESPSGCQIGRARLSSKLIPGQIFSSMHWTNAQASVGRVNAVIPPLTDPYSGQPSSKLSPVSISSVDPLWSGVLISRNKLSLREYPLSSIDFVVESRCEDGYRYALAQLEDSFTQSELVFHLGEGERRAQRLERVDSANNSYRGIQLLGEKLDWCLILGSNNHKQPYNNLERLLLQPLERKSLSQILSLKLSSITDPGSKTICACNQVSSKTIQDCISSGKARTVEQVGTRTNAGTNCGSCIPQISELLEAHLISSVN